MSAQVTLTQVPQNVVIEVRSSAATFSQAWSTVVELVDEHDIFVKTAAVNELTLSDPTHPYHIYIKGTVAS